MKLTFHAILLLVVLVQVFLMLIGLVRDDFPLIVAAFTLAAWAAVVAFVALEGRKGK
jgi:hypothetical protein